MISLIELSSFFFLFSFSWHFLPNVYFVIWLFKSDVILQTSSSLKFTVLNPRGRIWTMVAGGGASVIYADTVSIRVSRLNSQWLNMLRWILLSLSCWSLSCWSLLWHFCVLNIFAIFFWLKIWTLHSSLEFLVPCIGSRAMKLLMPMPNNVDYLYLGWRFGLCIRTWKLCRVQWSSKWGWGFAVC